MHKLNQSTIEKLGHYVYLLTNPKTGRVFYVGKGQGNRINQHLLGAYKSDTKETQKIKIIRDIEKSGKEVRLDILRHGLSKEEAFEIECAMIDYIGIKNLSNLVQGHYHTERGKMQLKDIIIEYEPRAATFSKHKPVILININKRYYPDITPYELREATRKHWYATRALNDGIKIACSVYRGIIREVFVVDRWLFSPEPNKGRVYFKGEVAPKNVRNQYLYKSVAKYWKQGNQNPIRYSS